MSPAAIAASSLLVACLGAAGVADGASRYRLVKPAIVPIERVAAPAGGGYDFDVYVRLNRALPRVVSGTLNATLELVDAGGDTHVAAIGRRSGHCYGAPIDPSFTKSHTLRHPRPGAIVKVTLRVAGRRVARVTTHLSKALHATTRDGDAPYARRLGC